MSNFLVALAVFIITVVGALFTVPYFIDWNGYRGVFEEEASHLLGREVRVGGAVNLHLLPTPYFRFEKVRIANTSVNLDDAFFRADSLTVKLSVPPLFRGAVEANEIEFQRPVLSLAPDSKGGWNWQSFGQALGNAPYLPTNIALTSLKIKDGVLAVHGVDGAVRMHIEGVEGELSSPAIDGPYRFRGTYGGAGAERELRIATAKPEGDGAVRFRASLRLADVGSSYALDARLLDLMGKPRIDGELTAKLPVRSIWPAAPRGNAPALTKEPGTLEAAKTDTSDLAFDLKAAVAADAGGATLSDLALSFEQDGRPQLLTGELKAAWRNAFAVDMSLSSRWLDLDRFTGSVEATSPLQSIIPLAMRLRDLLPAEGRSRASFAVDQANIGHEAISGVRLSLLRSKDKLEVEELRLGMPGGSRGELQGVVSGPPDAPVFEGSVGMRGTSIVRFASWATGNALAADPRADGPFGIRSQLSIAPGRVSVRNVIGDLPGSTIYGSGHYHWEGRPELSLSFEGPQLDVRAFVHEGTSLPEIFDLISRGPPTSQTAASPISAKHGWGAAQIDALIRVNAGQVVTASRTYRDVQMEIESKGGTLRMPFLRISGDEGYSLELEGEVQDTAARPKGSVRATLNAETPQGIAPLADLLGIPDALRPNERRSQALAPLRLAGSMTFGIRTPGSADVVVDGEASGAMVKMSARFDGAATGWRKGGADLTGVIEGPEASRIVAALIGAAGSRPQSAGPGRILFKAGGVPADGLTSIASIEAGDVALAFRGQVVVAETGSKVAGDIEIKGADATRIAALAGLAPPLRLDGLPVSGALKLSAADGAISIERLALKVGGSELRGELSLSPGGEQRRIDAKLAMDEITLANLLAPLLDQRLSITGAAEAALSGRQGLWPDDRFDPAVIDDFQGNIKISAKRLTLADQLVLKNPSLDVAIDSGRIDVKKLTGEGLGGSLSALLSITKAPSGAEVTGSLRFNPNLEAVATVSGGGQPRASGPVALALDFTGRGNSPRAVMSALHGRGTAELGEAKLSAIWPGAVRMAVEAALKVEPDKMAATLRQALASGLSTGTMQLGPNTLQLEIAEGQLRTKPITIETAEGRATGSTMLDLRTLAFESEWRIEQKRADNAPADKPGLPGVAIVYRGPATALSNIEPHVSTEALERELSVRRMERDVEELERLRQLDEARRQSEPEPRPEPPPIAPPRPERRPPAAAPVKQPTAVQPAAPG